jgi:hypothetical protein
MPEMGTIELRAFRGQVLRTMKYRNKDYGLHEGCVSERSKMAGWHRVRYYISQATRLIPVHM